MIKKLTIIAVVIASFAIASPMVGGFGAPIYFPQYDKNKINAIKQVKNVDHIEISYQMNVPILAKIAKQIRQNLQSYKIIVKQFNLKNTQVTKYNTSSVIVVIYFTPSHNTL